MNRILLYLSLFFTLTVNSQSSEKYNSEYADFFRAEELFQKEQYAAARKEFGLFIETFSNTNDPFYIKARYYEAIAALELYNNDAVQRLLDFLKSYPESGYRSDIYFRLAKDFYYRKKYEDALVWFNKLSSQDIAEEDRDEFYFKMGYSNFKLEKYEEARNAFYEVKDGSSQYANPALYYYSYIAYHNNAYETALQGFLKLENDESFGKITPYYIAQIYYLQGRYEEVTTYAPKISGDVKVSEKDLNLIIGDAYFRTGKFDDAIPYLEKYNKAVNPTREEYYRLGFAYYKNNEPAKAIPMFDRAKQEKDSLGQVAYYHIAECMLQLDNKMAARSAFEGAAYIDADPIVAEDALFNFAILSYKLDVNPYDEAVLAFERYLNKYPNTARTEDIYQYLVNVYTSTNNYDKALASLDNIPNKDIRLKSAYQMVAFNQGVKRFQAGDYTGAINSFKLVQKFPVDPSISGKAIYWIADANFRLNNFDAAIDGFKIYIAGSGGNTELQSEARYGIGYAHLNKSYQYDEEGKQGLKKDQLQRAIEMFRVFTESGTTDKRKKSDAYLRIADAYYVLKENEQAVKYYQEVLNTKSGFEDQALFYQAKTYGYLSGRGNDKIEALETLISNYPASTYLFAAVKEIADTYKSQGKFDKALSYYQRLIKDYPNSVLVIDAKINMADIYFKQAKYGTAEDNYLLVLEQYGSDQTICKRVSEGLKDLYVAMNQPDKIESLAKQYACFEFSADEQENLYYLPAMDAYGDSTKQESVRFAEAIPKFERYLEKFPNGRYKNDVKNYLANCHFNLGNVELAVEIYRETLEGQNTGHTELAASRVAQYLYNNKRYEEVIPYYLRLESVSQTPEVVFNAKLGLMRSYFLVEMWQDAAKYAAYVMMNPQLSNELKLEAHYAGGMANYYAKRYEIAKSSLVWLVQNTTTSKGSEAKFCLADMAYRSEQYEEADALVTELLKMKPTYNYWVAKGIILRSRILMKQGDLFASEKNLQSVIEHYPIADDGIIDEAMELHQELMQLKNEQKEIEPESDPVIDINGQ